MKSGARFGGVFDIWCYRPNGEIRWKDQACNKVVDEGLNHILNILLKNGTTSDPWYIGLTDTSPTVASDDTLTGTHSGWSEITAYDEGSRQEFVDDALSSQSVDNSASMASFSINSNGTVIGGAFLSDSSSTGSNGKLLCAAAFSGGDKTADSGDTLKVKYTFSAADDGS